MNYISQNTKYTLIQDKNFEASYKLYQDENGITYVRINAACTVGSAPLAFTFSWVHDDIDIAATWSPVSYHNKQVRPDWGSFSESSATYGAPVFTNMSYDDRNRLTIACSDVKNRVGIRCGVHEESAELYCCVRVNVAYPIEAYQTEIRIDTRDIPFYNAVNDVVKWWEGFEGNKPAPAPKTARLPFYSTWYSFHHDLDAARLLSECRYFKAAGCDALLVDGGWYKENNIRGLGWSGDWIPAKNKFGEIKSFIDAVHSINMKVVFWFAVGFVGIHSNAYTKWKDKLLDKNTLDALPLDPRYPEVRQHLIEVWTNAVTEWGLDGFKFDFIDSIPQSVEFKAGMDTISVYDAIDRLMKDALAALRKLKPDILIEFRQNYIGPLMRTYGNMLRSTDCPNDSYSNRMNVLSLRLTSAATPVHSDMVMWNYNEPAEIAAFQLTSVLFSVPQISVLSDSLSDEHKKLLTYYLRFWREHRDTLLDGEIHYRGYAANFAYVSARSENEQIGAVYSGRIAYVEIPTDRVIIVNASKEKEILITGLCGKYMLHVTDCMGQSVEHGFIEMDSREAYTKVASPVNGYIELEMC